MTVELDVGFVLSLERQIEESLDTTGGCTIGLARCALIGNANAWQAIENVGERRRVLVEVRGGELVVRGATGPVGVYPRRQT